MSEPKIGRVLAASLHQAIDELLPTRVEFYENWLTAGRVRQGELGRARVMAVISFLRTEGDAYDAVVDLAGRYTVDWTVDAVPAVERAALRLMPRPLRIRAVLGRAGRLIRGLHVDGRLETTVRRGKAVIQINRSLFCNVRESTTAPLCRFYSALIARCLEVYGIPCRARVSCCRATGAETCEVTIETL
jgi:predicted hydrocarbon binding protein